MFNTFLANQALPIPTNVHIYTVPNPPAHGGNILVYITFDASIYRAVGACLVNGIFTAVGNISNPGDTSMLIENFVSGLNPGDQINGFLFNAVTFSINSWPRSAHVVAPETLIVV